MGAAGQADEADLADGLRAWWAVVCLGGIGIALRLGALEIGFVFGFGGWLRKALLTKRLGRFCAWRGGVFGWKLALFGFALSRATRCPIGRNVLLHIDLCAFDFSKNWLCFFK